MYTNHYKQICKYCGRLIDVACIKRHEAAHENPNSKKYNNTEIHLDHDDLFCKYCGKECKNKNSLAQHEIRCPQNPTRKDFNNLGNYSTLVRKGKTAENCEEIARAAETLSARYKNNELISSVKGNNFWVGRHHSEETKEKQRLKLLDYIKNLKGEIQVHYSLEGCKYIDNLNKKYNWQLQHAENGGEYCVGGYFLDGYDKELNIAFEYDEPRHYVDVYNNVLCDRDIQRMQFIINKLSCRFIRYNQKLNLLYEIDSNLNIVNLK